MPVIPAEAGIQLLGPVFADTEKLDPGLRRDDEPEKKTNERQK